MKMTNSTYQILIGILILAIILVKVDSCNRIKQSNKNEVALANSLNDVISTSKTDDSLSRSRISVLETTNTNALLNINSKDEQIIELQAAIKEHANVLKKVGNTVIALKSEVLFYKTAATQVSDSGHDYTEVIKGDTVIRTIYPEYRSVGADEWIDYNILASRTNTSLNLKVINKYIAVIGYEKGKTFVEVTNLNPYSTTTALRAFQVKEPPPKKFGIGIGAGIGIASSFKISPYIGIGLQYNLIRF